MNARAATAADNDMLRRIATHPSVMRWTAKDGQTAADFHPEHYTDGKTHSFAIVIEDKLGPVGFFSLFALEQHAYAVHTNLLPSCRGARAIEAGQEGLEFAFIHTDATYLTSMVPECNPQALWFAHAVGFRDTFKQEARWLSGGEMHDIQHLRMDVDEWIQRLSMCEQGQAFHEVLEQHGGHVSHGKDLVHDAYVGAAWAMTMAGRINKGFSVYGRWARSAGYLPYQVLSEDPLRIDIGEHVLRVENGSFVVEEATCLQ